MAAVMRFDISDVRLSNVGIFTRLAVIAWIANLEQLPVQLSGFVPHIIFQEGIAVHVTKLRRTQNEPLTDEVSKCPTIYVVIADAGPPSDDLASEVKVLRQINFVEKDGSPLGKRFESPWP